MTLQKQALNQIEAYNQLRYKEETMKKIKENTSLVTAIVFLFSMVGSVGAIEANNFMIGAMMALTGIVFGLITIALQNK
jgi:Pyruvate/2-oxoacid:ferredoxin oxidoreductase gamma subunit